MPEGDDNKPNPKVYSVKNVSKSPGRVNIRARADDGSTLSVAAGEEKPFDEARPGDNVVYRKDSTIQKKESVSIGPSPRKPLPNTSGSISVLSPDASRVKGRRSFGKR